MMTYEKAEQILGKPLTDKLAVAELLIILPKREVVT